LPAFVNKKREQAVLLFTQLKIEIFSRATLKEKAPEK